MSLDDYRIALAEVEQQGDAADFVGERPEGLIAEAEAALDVRFPPSYRAFVRDLGAGDIGGHEFFGVIDDEFEHSAVPNGIWLTLQERTDSDLPRSLVLVYATGDGSYYALDVGAGQDPGAEESPVVVWTPGLSTSDQDPEVVASSFGEFFRRTVEASVN